MADKLKIYQKVTPVFLLPICTIAAFAYGWSAFATITARSGLNGSMYAYYNLTRIQFAIYTSLVSIAATVFVVLQAVYLFSKNATQLAKLFWIMLFSVAFVIACEGYLATRFVGKG
jgi:hypothetical protein